MSKPKVIIELRNIKSKIHGLNYRDYKVLRKVCGWRDKGYFFSKKHKNSKWDGYHTLLSKKGNFPTGLYGLILEKLEADDISYKLVDKRQKFEIDENKILKRLKDSDTIIRPYQIDGLMEGLKNPYMLFEWATGSGKSVLFAMLIRAYKLRTLIIVNSRDLMHQLAKEIADKAGVKVGKIGDGIWDPQRVTVAIVDSLVNKLDEERVRKFLSVVQYFIADESHHLGATTWKKVAFACTNAIVRHGFSGTCFRTDSKDIMLMAATGPVMHKKTPSELIEEGWLSKPHITLCYMDETTNADTWNGVERELITENRNRNLAACGFTQFHYENNRQVLLIVRRIKHAKLIYDMLMNEFHVPYKDVKYATGQDDTHFRRTILDDFRNRRLPILIGTSIYDEGVDLPSADAGVNLAGGDSDIKTVQRLGRILRKTKGVYDTDIDPDKPQIVNYLDFIDKGHEWTQKHSYNRLSVYESEEAFVCEKTDGRTKEWFPQYRIGR